MKRSLLILALALAAAGCEGKAGVVGDGPAKGPTLLDSTPDEEAASERPSAEQPSTQTPTNDPEVEQPATSTPEEPEIVWEAPEFTSAQIVEFARSISQMLISRPLTPAEITSLEQGGEAALEPMLRQWATLPAFAENARFMMQTKLKASGQRDDIDMELPGNLVRHVVKNDLPWSTILTADYCVGATGDTIDCDSGAPYVAGVLSTRAYLAGNASRFNLGRAATMMEVFACRIYPMEADLQPYLDKEQLIPMFQANSAAEQTVAEAEGGFGNGNGCYTCHGQFGAHAQLFVKFDETGMYRPEATGLQDPDGELGRSLGGLMTSHFNDAARAADERSQMLGQSVGNLAEAARVLADSEPFLECQTEAVLHHTFGLPEATELSEEMLHAVAVRARQMHADPTFADLVVATFTEPRVILSVVGGEPGGTE